MTNAFIIMDKTKIEVLVGGHSGYEEIGKDIVCASISSLMNYVANLISLETSNFTYEVDEKNVSMKLVINENNKTISNIIKCLINSFNDISLDYKKYFKLKIENNN